MRKGILLTVFAALVSVIVYSYSGGAAAQGGVDGTKASGGSGGCGNCHNSGTETVTVQLINSGGTAVTSYTPGTAYTVKLSSSNNTSTTLRYFGFQLAMVKLTGAGSGSAVDAGTWGAVSGNVQNTSPSNSGLPETIIEQSSPISPTTGTGGNGTTYVESVPWTAPAAGTGSVVLYGVINELSSQSTSKYVVASSVTITETTSVPVVASVSIAQTAGSASFCQGTSATFTATPTNGGSTPTYQWKVNGTAVSGATAATYTTTTLPAGSDAITCVMTSNLSGVTGSPATSNSVTVTVNASVTPTITISSNVTTTCSGQSVNFTSAITNGGSAPTYQWKLNGTAISGATASTYSSSSLANNSAITCDVTSNATCPSPATAPSNTITITISSSIVPSISIVSGAGNSVCAGQSVTLTATPTNGGTAPVYQWYKNGTAISGATNSTYTTTTLVNNDAITCGLTSNAACLSTTTATSNAITFNITANGTASVSIASNVGSSICSGESVTFTATPTNGGSAPTYQWYNGSTAISGATSSTYTSTSLSSGEVVTCKIVSNSQCVNSSNATSNAITMTISGAIVPAVSISSNQGNAICNGQSVTFTASPVNGGSSPAYQWYNGGSAISGATSSAYTTSTLTNNSVITVVLTSSSLCASPSTATSNAISMSVGTGGTATVAITSSSGTSVCTNQNVTLTANPGNGGSAPAYQWLLNGNNISGATNATYSPSSIANGSVYSVQLTSNSTCVSQSTVVSSPVTFTVVQGGAAQLSITSNVGLNICQGTGVTFTATPYLGGGNPTFQWAKNGSNVGNGSATYIDNALANGDIVSCSVTSSLSCASPATATSNSLTMNVFTAPAASISVVGGALQASQGNSYQWFLNNISVSGGTNQLLVPAANGSYTVEVTDAHGCQSISSPFPVTSVGISEVSALGAISVYPNPVGNSLFIDFNGQVNDGKIIIRLLDINGRVLIENANAPVSGEKISMDVQNVQNGIYLLQISQNDATAYRKVVVSR